MKKSLFLLPVLALAACDNNKPKYDMTLSCDDGANGKYLVEAKVYETKADLIVTRLSKELRGKHKEWLADHLWLYNKVPEIGDTVKVSVPAREAYSDYVEKGQIRLDVGHDLLDGGLRFTLWHASDNNLTLRDGEKIENGEWMVGSPCEPVIDRRIPNYGNIAPEMLKEIKACAAYLQDQAHSDTIAPGTAAFIVYDENSDREMIVTQEQMDVFTNGVELHHYFLYNMSKYPEDASHACEVANKLRAYINEHIDAEGKPIYVIDNMYCDGSDSPETTKFEIYRRYAKVYIGKETYRLEKSRWGWGKDPTVTFEDGGVTLVAQAYSKENKIGFVLMDRRCFFDETEENNPAQKKQTKTIEKELMDKIFSQF